MVHGGVFLGLKLCPLPQWVLVVDHACPEIGILELAQLRSGFEKKIGTADVREDHGTVAATDEVAIMTELNGNVFQGAEGDVAPG